MTPHELSVRIKEKAAALGFSGCGIARAEHLAGDEERLKRWLDAGRQAGMQYMERNFEKRTDPRLLAEGTKTVISLLYNYFPGKETNCENGFRLAKYAYGVDYHELIREKLDILCKVMLEIDHKAVTRGFVDSAPVLERAWANRAGLGWIGKNGMLITRKQGSFFFLAEILTSLEPEYDDPFAGNYCGNCSECLDACPTGAIAAPGIIDANRCISYLTIENKGEIPESLRGKWDKWIFGCDACQDVCPWNRFSVGHAEPAFVPTFELASMQTGDWLDLDKERFGSLFKHSAVKRCKYEGLKRNIDFVNAKEIHDSDCDS